MNPPGRDGVAINIIIRFIVLLLRMWLQSLLFITTRGSSVSINPPVQSDRGPQVNYFSEWGKTKSVVDRFEIHSLGFPAPIRVESSIHRIITIKRFFFSSSSFPAMLS